MINAKHKIISAMFDIKPVDDSGNIDISKIYNIQPVLNLGRRFRINKSGKVSFKNQKPAKNEKFSAIDTIDGAHRGIEKCGIITTPQEELEKYLNEDLDSAGELTLRGVNIVDGISFRLRRQKIKREKWNLEPEEVAPVLMKEDFQDSDLLFQEALTQINQRMREEPLLIVEPDEIVKDVKDGAHHDIEKYGIILTDSRSVKKNFVKIKLPKLSRVGLTVVATSISLLILFGYYGFNLKKELVAEGNSAVAKLENAGENIKNMDFVSASSDFAEAYQEFSKAGDNLNFMGAGISYLLSDLPGFDKLTAGGSEKLKSAKNLVEAGKLMANAGQAMSDAMSELAKTNLILSLNPLSPTSGSLGSDVSMGEISSSLKKALVLSKKNLENAKELLADIDASSIPENKKASFEEFKSKLPLFEKLISDSVDYSKFLEDFIGTKGTKKYLILFQNPSELRPTGGFPGTYGVVSFKDGKLQDFKVDDVYNLDGQLKELIVPPLQLQHITPNWGMRDANWFVDFPTSARKISSFFKKEAGYGVDGVITFSPKIVANILEVVGSVEMPEYDLTLDSDNLFPALQEEVEYKGDRKQPKQVIVDLAPIVLEKLYSAEPEKWLEVFNLLVSSMEEKDILMYFRDLNLQSFSVDKGFSGQVKNTDSDYLMVTFSNVKGSKTDLVTDSSLKVQTVFETGDVKHKVSITRTHNGGDSKYGFYNKQNPTYVRVLVPNDAEFVDLTGNSRPAFKPLIDYANSGFSKDEDLARFENGSYTDKKTGVTIYKEAGKKEFGFWTIINPGETKTIELEYTVPLLSNVYQLHIQKQPGLEVENLDLLFSGREIIKSTPELNKMGDEYFANTNLRRDIDLNLLFK